MSKKEMRDTPFNLKTTAASSEQAYDERFMASGSSADTLAGVRLIGAVVFTAMYNIGYIRRRK